MANFEYQGKPLKIARYADIPGSMKPDGRFREQVQAVLDNTEPWNVGDNPIETKRFNFPIFPMAVPLDGRSVTWGVHRGHKAREPRLSPFVEGRADAKLMGYVTVELDGTGESPLLVRAYGGDYTPPLPWMTSARDALGGKEACAKYWQSHAYLNRAPTLIRFGTATTEAPDWYVGG